MKKLTTRETAMNWWGVKSDQEKNDLTIKYFSRIEDLTVTPPMIEEMWNKEGLNKEL